MKTNRGRIFGFVLPNSDLFDSFECCLISTATADVFNLVFGWFFCSKVYAENQLMRYSNLLLKILWFA